MFFTHSTCPSLLLLLLLNIISSSEHILLEKKNRTIADHHQRQCDAGLKTILPQKGPSSSQTLLPLGGFLLLLTGLTLTGTLIGLAVTTPLFVICSPVLLPAALVIAFSVLGFITSGAFGITALSSLSWMARYLRRMRLPEQVEHAKRRVQDTAGEVGKKARETGQSVQGKAQEVVKGQEDGQKQEGGKT